MLFSGFIVSVGGQNEQSWKDSRRLSPPSQGFKLVSHLHEQAAFVLSNPHSCFSLFNLPPNANGASEMKHATDVRVMRWKPDLRGSETRVSARTVIYAAPCRACTSGDLLPVVPGIFV